MSPRSARVPPARGWHAFTLMEMVLSMAIVALACTACFSVTTLLLRAASASADTAPAGQTAAARDALDQITRDARMATDISEQTATSIAFSVPDRTGDGVPETIRYAWAGPGSPITREYNGGSPVTVLASAQNFALAYTMQTVGPPPPQVSGEQLLFSYDDATATSKFGLKSTAWAAMFVKPTLPANTVSWSITRVRIQGIKMSKNIVYAGEIRAIDASNKPTGAALATSAFNSNSFAGTATWLDLPFTTPASPLNPTAGYAVVVRGSSSATIGVNLMYDNSTVSSTARGWTTSTNSGSTWTTPSNTMAMQVYIYGTVTTQ